MDRAAPGKGLPAAARSDVQGSPRESLWERARPALPHTASKALESHGESSLGSLVTPGVRRMFGLEHRFLFLRGGFLRVQLPKNSLTIHPPPLVFGGPCHACEHHQGGLSQVLWRHPGFLSSAEDSEAAVAFAWLRKLGPEF